jgi:hypothetical protein
MGKKAMVSPLMPPCYASSMSKKYGHASLYAKGLVGEKAYLVTINTRVFMTIAKLDITFGLSERCPPTWCTLQTTSGRSSPFGRRLS